MIEDIVTKMMNNVTEGLKESDKMFLELETKKIKFDEKQKKEERKFQLEMMRM